VLVDDVPRGGRVDRCDHGDEVAVPERTAQRLEQVAARRGLVGDHERVRHGARAPSRERSPLKIACRAPGTPYSYGLPTTCGISSKLKIGGGEETCHSSVSARHGFAAAAGPRAHAVSML